jgi:hypothetical protein
MLMKSAPSHGVSAIMLSTSTASLDGSKLDKSALLTTETGSSKSTESEEASSSIKIDANASVFHDIIISQDVLLSLSTIL